VNLRPRLARVAERLAPPSALDFPFLAAGDAAPPVALPPEPDPLAEERRRRLADLDRIARRP